MNRHFRDSLYYLGRAGEHAKEGLLESLEPVENRLRDRLGWEKEPEPTRIERIAAELRDLERRAEGESRKAIHAAREQLLNYRGEETVDEAAEHEDAVEATAD